MKYKKNYCMAAFCISVKNLEENGDTNCSDESNDLVGLGRSRPAEGSWMTRHRAMSSWMPNDIPSSGGRALGRCLEENVNHWKIDVTVHQD